MTSTVRASEWGTAAVAKIPFTVGTAMAARISAGIAVQMISTVVFPWICLGSASPGFPWKRKMAYSSAPSTRMKTPNAHQKVVIIRSSPILAKSERGFRLVWE